MLKLYALSLREFEYTWNASSKGKEDVICSKKYKQVHGRHIYTCIYTSLNLLCSKLPRPALGSWSWAGRENKLPSLLLSPTAPCSWSWARNRLPSLLPPPALHLWTWVRKKLPNPYQQGTPSAGSVTSDPLLGDKGLLLPNHNLVLPVVRAGGHSSLLLGQALPQKPGKGLSPTPWWIAGRKQIWLSARHLHERYSTITSIK